MIPALYTTRTHTHIYNNHNNNICIYIYTYDAIAYCIRGIAVAFMPVLKLAPPWSPRVDFKSSAAASLIFLEALSFGSNEQGTLDPLG